MTTTKGPRLKHKGEAATVGLMIFALVIIGGNLPIVAPTLPECSDGIDNDDGMPPNPPEAGDGFIDKPFIDPNGFHYVGPGGYNYGDLWLPPGELPTDIDCSFEDTGGGGYLPCPLWISEAAPPQNANQCYTGDPAAAP